VTIAARSFSARSVSRGGLTTRITFTLFPYSLDTLYLPEQIALQMQSQPRRTVPGILHIVFDLTGGDGLVAGITV
jgi:hypothetical protein